jgi:hypothetical protein
VPIETQGRHAAGTSPQPDVEGVEPADQTVGEGEHLRVDEVDRIAGAHVDSAVPNHRHRVPLLDQPVQVQLGDRSATAVRLGREGVPARQRLRAMQGPHHVLGQAGHYLRQVT